MKDGLGEEGAQRIKRSSFAIRRAFAWIFAAAAISPTLLASLARWSFVADLAANFRVHVMWCSLLAALPLLVARRFRPAVVVLMAALWNAALVAPCYFSPEKTSPADAGPTRRILFANILYNNPDLTTLFALIEREDPDTIVLVEVTSAQAKELAELDERYPFREVAAAEGAFGIALYSRRPTAIERLTLSDSHWGVALLGVQTEAGKPLRILGVHPPPPVSRRNARDRNEQLLAAAETLKRDGGDALLIGDFNITPWSPFFSDALAAGDLRDSRRGYGVQPSWPVNRIALGIPIDHCLHSEGVVIRDRRLGPPIGSDHLPVIVDYVVSPSNKTTTDAE